MQVSEADVNFIENGSKVNVYISSLSSQPFAGTVISVDRMAGPMNRKFTVRVGLDKPEPQMRPGMFAEVVLATEEAENTLCVPIEAVIARGEKSVVYTVDAENRARPIEVSTVIANDRLIQIVDGLEAGTPVITKGNTLSQTVLVRWLPGGEGMKLIEFRSGVR